MSLPLTGHHPASDKAFLNQAAAQKPSGSVHHRYNLLGPLMLESQAPCPFSGVFRFKECVLCNSTLSKYHAISHI